MTQQGEQLFTVGLKHVSADGKRAGAELPTLELNYISLKQIRSLLMALEALAPKVTYPAEPEVRLNGAAGKFVVRVKGAQLHLVSWSSAHKGGVVTADQVIDAISGAEAAQEAVVGTTGGIKTARGMKEKLVMVALGLAIVAVNTFTIWLLTRPPRNNVSEYRLISSEQAKRVLESAVGAYETGKAPGDRRIEIAEDATVKRIKYGSGQTVKDFQTFTVQPVESKGQLALLTNRPSLIAIKDSVSVVLYGDTYVRVKN